MLDNRIVNRALHRKSMKVEQPACRILLDLDVHIKKMKEEYLEIIFQSDRADDKIQEISKNQIKRYTDMRNMEDEILSNFPVNA